MMLPFFFLLLSKTPLIPLAAARSPLLCDKKALGYCGGADDSVRSQVKKLEVAGERMMLVGWDLQRVPPSLVQP
jgi:hypothetical protein